ncbi:hypothetical protein TNCV_1763071 [Trichonephila clavipes]|nr:hypothetical protein TNCV_1763071 [Trichonephila clavipes]
MEENFEKRLVHSKELESEAFRDIFVVSVNFLSHGRILREIERENKVHLKVKPQVAVAISEKLERRSSRKADRNSFRRIVTNVEKKPETNEIIRSFDEMPGPKPLPIIGNLWRYFPIIGNYSFERIHKSYAKLHEEYGPIVKEKVFGDRILVHVFDPYDMYKVYQSGGNSPIRMSHRALARYRRARPHLYSGPGLFPR